MENKTKQNFQTKQTNPTNCTKIKKVPFSVRALMAAIKIIRQLEFVSLIGMTNEWL